jgi:hypothetical protein
MSCGDLQAWAQDHKAVWDAVMLAAFGAALAVAWLLRRRPGQAAAGLVLAALAAGLSMSMDDFLHPWDERFHAVVARNLLSHPLVPTLYDRTPLPGSLDWVSTHVFLHKPPLSLWLIAASLRLAGSCELAVRLPSVLMLGAAMLATFRIGALLYEPRVGLVAAFLVAVNGELLDLASGRTYTDHPDSLLISLVCVGVWLALEHARRPGRWLAVVVGAAAGGAFLTKEWPALLVLGVWAIALPRTREAFTHLAMGAASCAAVALPWQGYVHARFPAEAAWEMAYNTFGHFRDALEEHAGSPFFHLARLPRFFGEASPLALLAFAAFQGRTRPGRILLAWFVVPYAVFSLAATKMPAYPLIAAPAIALMIAWAVIDVWNWLPRLFGARKEVAAVLITAWLMLPLRFAIERWKPFERFDAERAAAHELKALSPPRDAVLFGLPDPISAMFYTGVPAYAEVPGDADRARCVSAGYRPIVLGTRPLESIGR